MTENPTEQPEASRKGPPITDWGLVQEYGAQMAGLIQSGLMVRPESRTSDSQGPREVTAAEANGRTYDLMTAREVADGTTLNAMYSAATAFPPHDGTTSAANGWNSELGVAINGGDTGCDAGDH